MTDGIGIADADIKITHEIETDVPAIVDPVTQLSQDTAPELHTEKDELVFFRDKETADALACTPDTTLEDRQRFHDVSLKLQAFVDGLVAAEEEKKIREAKEAVEAARAAEEEARMAAEEARTAMEEAGRAEAEATAAAERQQKAAEQARAAEEELRRLQKQREEEEARAAAAEAERAEAQKTAETPAAPDAPATETEVTNAAPAAPAVAASAAPVADLPEPRTRREKKEAAALAKFRAEKQAEIDAWEERVCEDYAAVPDDLTKKDAKKQFKKEAAALVAARKVTEKAARTYKHKKKVPEKIRASYELIHARRDEIEIMARMLKLAKTAGMKGDVRRLCGLMKKAVTEDTAILPIHEKLTGRPVRPADAAMPKAMAAGEPFETPTNVVHN